MAVRWEDQYATGEAKIDDQHRRLFDMVNRLESQVQKANLDRALVESVVSFLAIYVKTHFTYEEKWMERVQCPAAGQNKEDHAQFARFLLVVQERLAKEGVTHELACDLYAAAEDLVVNHVCKVDTQLKCCLHKLP